MNEKKEENENSILFCSNLEDAKKTDDYEAIQHMLYSESTPFESGNNFKEKGNEKFKKKKYKSASLFYTQGLNVKNIKNNVLLIQLYNNRAECNLKLKNFGKCIEDCKIVLEKDKKNIKAYYRIIKSYISLCNYQKAIVFCDEVLNFENKNKKLFEILKKQSLEKLNKEKEKEFKKKNHSDKLTLFLNNKKIKISTKNEFENVHKDIKINPKDENLCFKVVFLYYQFNQSDMIDSFHEKSTFFDELSNILPPNGDPLPWGGKEGEKYNINNIKLFFFNTEKKKNIFFDINSKLIEILTRDDYLLPNNLVPTFHIISKELYKEGRW